MYACIYITAVIYFIIHFQDDDIETEEIQNYNDLKINLEFSKEDLIPESPTVTLNKSQEEINPSDIKDEDEKQVME